MIPIGNNGHKLLDLMRRSRFALIICALGILGFIILIIAGYKSGQPSPSSTWEFIERCVLGKYAITAVIVLIVAITVGLWLFLRPGPSRHWAVLPELQQLAGRWDYECAADPDHKFDGGETLHKGWCEIETNVDDILGPSFSMEGHRSDTDRGPVDPPSPWRADHCFFESPRVITYTYLTDSQGHEQKGYTKAALIYEGKQLMRVEGHFHYFRHDRTAVWGKIRLTR